MEHIHVLSRRPIPADGRLPAGETALVRFDRFHPYPDVAAEASAPELTRLMLLTSCEGTWCTCRVTVRGYSLELFLELVSALHRGQLDLFVQLREQIERELQS